MGTIKRINNKNSELVAHQLVARQFMLKRGIKFIRSQNVYNDGLKLDDIAFITEAINQKKFRKYCTSV